MLPLSSGELWLTVIGQLVNFTGKPLTLTRWHFQVENAAGSRLADRDLLDTLEVKNDKRSLIEFMYSFKLPAGVKSGRVLIGTEATIAGRRRSGVREAPFELAKPVLLHSPVKGVWAYSNGPGELTFHIHNHHPEQRYAYDLGMRKDWGGSHSTFEGDPEKNESFFDWRQPFHAVADGTVIEVVDNVPDNFGRRENPANRMRTNSRIVVEHPGKKYSLYYHVSRGTAAVKVVQRSRPGNSWDAWATPAKARSRTCTSSSPSSTRPAASGAARPVHRAENARGPSALWCAQGGAGVPHRVTTDDSPKNQVDQTGERP